MFTGGSDSTKSSGTDARPALGGGSPVAAIGSTSPTSTQVVSEGSVELDELVEIAAQRCRLDHRESVLLAEVDESGICDAVHGHPTAMWLADRTKHGRKTALDRVRIAQLLQLRYPVLADALAEGLVGWQHVRTIDQATNLRNWRDIADLLPHLIDLAQVAGFERWANEVRGIGRRLDADGGYDPATDPTNNYLRLTPTTDGVTHISGQLVGELALTIRKLIEGETERVLKRYRHDAETTGGDTPVPSRAQAAAEGLGELLDRGSGVADGQGRLPEPEIVVILNEESGELTDDDGNHLSPHILRFIIAAGLIRPLHMSSTGDPLHMGRTLRYANRHQRRALLARDGGCIFPGCDRPASWCDAHHVDQWDHEGPTDIENLGLLCRHHHRVTHRPGWVMTRTTPTSDPDTADPHEVRFRWRTPSGRLIESQRHHQRSQPAAA